MERTPTALARSAARSISTAIASCSQVSINVITPTRS